MSDSNLNIYKAVYSGVPVYELMCRGIAVMRRKQDSYLNATQILKVAGIEKGKRTKILEREVLTGDHEKVQGGYGKYQGTWVPFQRGKDLATQYKVEPYLRTLLDYEIPKDADTVVPTKEMFHAAQKARDTPKLKKIYGSPRLSPAVKQSRSNIAVSTGSGSQSFHQTSMTPSPLHPSFNAPSPSIPPSPQWHTEHPPRKRLRTNHSPPPLHEFDDDGPSRPLMNHFPPLDHYNYNIRRSNHHQTHYNDSYDEKDYDQVHGSGQFLEQSSEEPLLEGAEKNRTILMSIFLNDEQDQIPGMLTDPESPPDLDINLVIDDQGHTALHWAAALARIPVLDLLVQKQVDIRRVNYNGESALVRAVLVTNNFDKQSFPHVLNLLHSAIPLLDRKNRSVLHHIAVTAGIRGRETSSRYYMECLLEWIAQHGGDFASIIDIQDKTGDTALTIAARVGDRYLTKILLNVGANREIENKVGLKAEDFGVDDFMSGSSVPPPPVRPVVAMKKESVLTETPSKRVVQRMVDELDLEFSHEIMARQGQLQDTQAQLRHSTGELSNTRRTIKQLRAQSLQLTEAQQKIRNLEQSLEEESQKTRSQKGYSSTLRQKDTANEDIDRLFYPPARPSSKINEDGSSGMTEKEREANAHEEVFMLKARILAYEQNEKELVQELADVKDQSLDRELQCRKVISICCNIPLEKVDEMLVPLTLAVESDGASLDLSRAAGFMSKVKKQDVIASTAFSFLTVDLDSDLERRLAGSRSTLKSIRHVDKNPTRHSPIMLEPLPPIRSRLSWPPNLDKLLCRPKIYVYPDPPAIKEVYTKVPPVHTPYISERILLEQLRDPSSSAYKNYVTLDPEEADFFYIPFLGARYLNHCWFILRKKDDCDVDETYVLPMMHYIQQVLPYWNRTQGQDHLIAHPMDRSSHYYQTKDIMENATFLTTIGDLRPIGPSVVGSRRQKNIVIPSATALLDLVKVDPLQYLTTEGYPRHKRRDVFVLFGGRYSDVEPEDVYSAGIRSLLLNGFDKQADYVIAAGWESDKYMKLLSRARYGLAPMSHTLDTTRVWEYLAFGVVPVIIADGIVEPYEDDVDWNSFSVRIARDDAHRMDAILRAIPEEEYQRKRERVWNYGRRVLLTRDSWHLIVRDLCRRGRLEGKRTIDRDTHVEMTGPFMAVIP
ncbi:transcriptional regulator swi6 [Mortierella sp. AM989]|nr:transcriptional regulator swi6 [Mortierella sp. AM989]